ncbi:hypothetical protein ROS9278_05077 [Roseomonas sp. CECT 9278]|nr:hypothetical protein ROS9278_05077 [Roseomonas sp. CECT 9278]
MQGTHAEAVLLQRLVQDVDLDLLVAEDQRVLHLLDADHAPQRLALVVRLHIDDAGGDGGGDGSRRRDRDLLGIRQEGIGQAADLGRHGGAEEQRLADFRQHAHDALDIGDEPHVQHAVGLVDHQQLAVRHQDAAAVEQVEQPARRGDQHVDALFEHVALVVHALPADQQGVVELEVLAVFLEVLGDLERQFARRLQDQAARHARLGARPGQDVQHRQHEGCGLAGAGLRAAQHVPVHQDIRDGLFLDGRGVDVAGFRDGAQEFVGQAKVGEGGARGRFLLGIVGHLVLVLVLRRRGGEGGGRLRFGRGVGPIRGGRGQRRLGPGRRGRQDGLGGGLRLCRGSGRLGGRNRMVVQIARFHGPARRAARGDCGGWPSPGRARIRGRRSGPPIHERRAYAPLRPEDQGFPPLPPRGRRRGAAVTPRT